MSDGSGLPPLYPDLRKSDLLNNGIDALPCLILKGKKSEILTTVEMPGVELSIVDLSNLINYTTHEYGGGTLGIAEIKRLVESCK